MHLSHIPGLRSAISDRMPIWENGKIMGAVAIFRDRSEATSLAEELTGVRHLVEAMRAYTHEFVNKAAYHPGHDPAGTDGKSRAVHPGYLTGPPISR
ncbi:MAG: hypothetical protein ACLTR8_03470 [Oscillospiraceae bacterium]